MILVNHTEYYAQLFANFPEELQNLKQYTTLRGKGPDYTRLTTRTWKDKQALSTLEGAKLLAESDNPHLDIGFVMWPPEDMVINGKQLCFIDLDKCYDPKTKEINDDALKIIKKCNSYTELSTSQKGFHIILWVNRTKTWPLKGLRNIGVDGLNGDVRFHSRYVLITGNRFENTPAQINEVTEDQIIEWFKVDTREDTGPVAIEVGEVIQTEWNPIEDQDDERWRKVKEMALFDLELLYLIEDNAFYVNRRLEKQDKSDNSGSGIAWRVLMRTWEMFNDPADMMAVYEYAYHCATGHQFYPTASSVRASVYNILKNGRKSMAKGERIDVIKKRAEDELRDAAKTLICNEERTQAGIDNGDYTRWRQAFLSVIGSEAEFISFYQQTWDQKYFLKVRYKGKERTVCTTSNPDYVPSFKSTIMPLFGVRISNAELIERAVTFLMPGCLEPHPPLHVCAARLWDQFRRDTDMVSRWREATRNALHKNISKLVERNGKLQLDVSLHSTIGLYYIEHDGNTYWGATQRYMNECLISLGIDIDSPTVAKILEYMKVTQVADIYRITF